MSLIWWDFIINPLIRILDIITMYCGSYGMGIIFFGLLSRIILFPLALVQLRNTLQTQELKPLLKEVDSYYNLKKMNKEEILERRLKRRELIQSSDVRPFTLGCLPFFIQIPVAIITYQVIINNKETLSNEFLWFSLGSTDQYYILPFIVGFSSFIQSRQQNPNQLKLSLFLSMIVFGISFIVPSAIAIYILTINIYSCGQYIFTKYLINKYKLIKLIPNIL